MHFLSENIVNFLNAYGYPAAFLAQLLAGPFGDAATGFFVAGGIFRFWPIYVLSVAADILSDIFYYELGRIGGRRILDKFSRLFSWSEAVINRVESHFRDHGKKTLAVVKFTHGVGMITQILAGTTRMPFRTYITVNLLTGSLQSLIWVGIGVLTGNAWQKWIGRAENVLIGFTLLLVVAIIVFFIVRAIQKSLSRFE